MPPRRAPAPAALAELADPHTTTDASALSPSPAAAIAALGLRPAAWAEVGPDAFFFGVNGAVALFAAGVWASGALPSVAAVADAAGAAGAGAASWAWVARVAAVNWAIMAAAYHGYHVLFFEGGWARLTGRAPTKFNPAGYERGQLAREVCYTTLAMGIASAYHALALGGAARGRWLTAPLPASAGGAAAFVATFAALALWSDLHFFFVHRLLHVPAIYARVHKLHHLSKNPGPWSGLSMHPVESALYLSKVLLPLALPHAHMLHFLFMLYNATLMPIPGHSGHEEALGNEYHWIHHHTFQGNYGSPAVPLDKLFGTHWQLKKSEKKAA